MMFLLIVIGTMPDHRRVILSFATLLNPLFRELRQLGFLCRQGTAQVFITALFEFFNGDEMLKARDVNKSFCTSCAFRDRGNRIQEADIAARLRRYFASQLDAEPLSKYDQKPSAGRIDSGGTLEPSEVAFAIACIPALFRASRFACSSKNGPPRNQDRSHE
jgi:hypothetical protein